MLSLTLTPVLSLHPTLTLSLFLVLIIINVTFRLSCIIVHYESTIYKSTHS